MPIPTSEEFDSIEAKSARIRFVNKPSVEGDRNRQSGQIGEWLSQQPKFDVWWPGLGYPKNVWESDQRRIKPWFVGNLVSSESIRLNRSFLRIWNPFCGYLYVASDSTNPMSLPRILWTPLSWQCECEVSMSQRCNNSKIWCSNRDRRLTSLPSKQSRPGFLRQPPNILWLSRISCCRPLLSVPTNISVPPSQHSPAWLMVIFSGTRFWNGHMSLFIENDQQNRRFVFYHRYSNRSLTKCDLSR